MDNYTDPRAAMRNAIITAATPCLVEALGLVHDAIKALRIEIQDQQTERMLIAPLERKLRMMDVEAQIEDHAAEREERKAEREERKADREERKAERAEREQDRAARAAERAEREQERAERAARFTA
jgi:choline-glycine betaine transporter